MVMYNRVDNSGSDRISNLETFLGTTNDVIIMF